ncbi:5-carboxymethyl-2-hydroxymuconate isomerase [Sphingomonas sp.]|uniref:5-carboxymethyl-2-hydroxymuconate isomerase n=1 Tax=Sphingomonas sp. TaxID=28214 RepID=UPI002DD62DB6|nr:5-carboxymethyl-2-hydroxymuconate isomerase [Sphingomonas sp.]
MAHATVEWTDNLEHDLDLGELLGLIAGWMRDHADGAFPIGGIRVRGIRITDYVIADGNGADDAFINIDVKMGIGRSEAFRRTFFDGLFAVIKRQLGDLFERRPVALSLYVQEVDGWKHNSIHQRLKKDK